MLLGGQRGVDRSNFSWWFGGNYIRKLILYYTIYTTILYYTIYTITLYYTIYTIILYYTIYTIILYYTIYTIILYYTIYTVILYYTIIYYTRNYIRTLNICVNVCLSVVSI
jgi:hypothetical protein